MLGRKPHQCGAHASTIVPAFQNLLRIRVALRGPLRVPQKQ